MVKIFVTGDNHLGLKYVSHEKAAALIAARLNAFEGMVRVANEENCSLFVITGDLFENGSGISKKDMKGLLDMLSRFRGTVAVLPGNHDYYDGERKVWQSFREAAQTRDNILLLTQYRPYSVSVGEEEAVLYPALCTSLHSAPGQNNLGWLKDVEMKDPAVYHIGIAHGAVEGETIDREGAYFLMKREELERIPVDVWLLGHTHVPFPTALTETFAPCEKILNPGTHVQTDVSCRTEGICFVVEIDESKQVRAKKYISGSLRFVREDIAVTAGSMEQQLAQKMAGLSDNSVVDISVSGAVTAEEYEDRAGIMERTLSRFLESCCHDNDLSKLISGELIDAEFAETSFAAGLLKALLDEPKEAQLVYDLLKTLKEGK